MRPLTPYAFTQKDPKLRIGRGNDGIEFFLLQFGRMFRGKLNLSLIFALSVANRPFSAEMRQNQILEVELESAKNREHAFNCIIELRRTVSFFANKNFKTEQK